MDPAELEQAIREDRVLRCDKCAQRAPVKPKMVFFGEDLPREFLEASVLMEREPDLCIIMGTALAVAPFNALPAKLDFNVPKVLINLNNTKDTCGLDFTVGSKKLFLQGKCDEKIRRIATDLGWNDDFEAILPPCHRHRN